MARGSSSARFFLLLFAAVALPVFPGGRWLVESSQTTANKPHEARGAAQVAAADEAYESGLNYLRAGQADKAIESLSTAVRREPKSKPARCGLGQAYINAGHLVEAVEQFRACVELDPSDPQAQFDLGQAYLRLARVVASKILEENNTSPYARRIFAKNYEGRNDLPEAETQYRLALAQEPHAVDLRLGLGNLYVQMGDLAKAREEFERAVNAAPSTRSSRKRTRAEIKNQQLSPDEIRLARLRSACGEQLRRGSEEQLREGSVIQVGRCAYEMAQYQQAYRLLSEAEKLMPRNLAALYWLQEAARRLAEQSFERIKQVNPDSYLLDLLSAQTWEEQQRPDLAIREYKAAIARRAEAPNIHLLLGHLYWRWGRYDEALPELLECLRLDPQEPAANYLVGDIWVQEEQPEKAVPYLRRALALRPRFLNAEASLGRALGQLKQYQAAIDELTAVAPADADGSIHYQLYQLYQKLGRNDEAQKALAAAERIRARRRPVIGPLGGSEFH